MALAALIIATVFLVFIFYGLLKHLKLKRIIDKIPGPVPYWIVGNALHFKRDPFEWQEQSAGVAELWSDPRVYRVWFFLTPYVIITGAEEAEPILTSYKHVIKTSDYEFLRPWLGRGLFANEGEPWRPRRKMMTPAFHGDIIKDFLPVFNRQGRILVNQLSKQLGQGPFDVYQYLSLCALAVIWESAMGTDMNIQLTKDTNYVRSVYTMGDIVYDRQRAPWFWPKTLFNLFGRGKEHDTCINTIHQVIAKVIDKRWKELHSNDEDHKELKVNGSIGNYKTRDGFIILDYWLEQVKKSVLTLKDVNEEANSLLFGGYDTTATSSNWTLHFIGCYPEIQAKVHQELDAVLGKDDEREITIEDLKDLVYLEYCIKESLRLYPPVSIFGRRIVEDIIVAGRRVPAHTQVLVSLYSIHRDPKHWKDPEKFIPERFAPENAVGRHPFAYIPFSAGIRNCIAQRFAMLEEKVILASILRRFKIKSLERPDQVRARPDLVLRPSRVLIEISPRR